MPDDDDEDCEHDLQLVEVIADEKGARLVHECAKGCGAVALEPSRSD